MWSEEYDGGVAALCRGGGWVEKLEEDSGRGSEGAGEPDRDRDRSVRLFRRRVCKSWAKSCVNAVGSKGLCGVGGGGGARVGGLEPAMMWIVLEVI